MRLVSVRSRVRNSLGALVRVGVVGNISACHADAPGSITGHGAFFDNIFIFHAVGGANRRAAEREKSRVDTVSVPPSSVGRAQDS